MNQQANSNVGDKSFLLTVILSVLVGTFGVDRFYLGHTGTGVFKLVTLGGLGVWWVIDLILIVTKNLKPADGTEYKD